MGSAVTQPTRKRVGDAQPWRRVSRPGRPTEIVSGPASLSYGRQQVDRSCDGHSAAQSRLSPAPAGLHKRETVSVGVQVDLRNEVGQTANLTVFYHILILSVCACAQGYCLMCSKCF